MGAFSRLAEAVRVLALVAASLLAALALAELGFALLLRHPDLVRGLPGGLLSHLRAYYLHHDRLIVQALPECALYDPGLFYALRPGSCRFRNREFDTTLRINSKGLRDSEEALAAPEVIVIGDSFAMGWGVEQEQAFPQVLGRLLGRRVLNAGVSSYGTVRELHLLDRLDTSRLRVLVVQYSANDREENRLFAERGNVLLIESERTYLQDVRRSERQRLGLGRITFKIVSKIFRIFESSSPEPPALTAPDQARLFLNALAHATTRDLSGVDVLVLNLEPYGGGAGDFVAALQREASASSRPSPVHQLHVADLRGRLEPTDYYTLDDHLRPSGHVKVAELVRDKLRELGL